MFTTKKEESFFLNHLLKEMKVLEYGSGESTIEIAGRVKSLISLEHQQEWFLKGKSNIPNNCSIVLQRPDLPYTEGGDCGTYDQFTSYIEYPILYGPYDLILIDGRARVGCASVCNKMSTKDTIIFIHDFNRKEYQEALNYLILIEQVETMAKFKIK